MNILIYFQFYNFNCSIPFWYLESCTHSFFVLTANVCVCIVFFLPHRKAYIFQLQENQRVIFLHNTGFKTSLK